MKLFRRMLERDKKKVKGYKDNKSSVGAGGENLELSN